MSHAQCIGVVAHHDFDLGSTQANIKGIFSRARRFWHRSDTGLLFFVFSQGPRSPHRRYRRFLMFKLNLLVSGRYFNQPEAFTTKGKCRFVVIRCWSSLLFSHCFSQIK